MSVWDWLLHPAGSTPGGFCLSGAPSLVGLHAVSDAVVGLSYLSIALALSAFARKRPDLQYSWAAYLFVAFILACGATHLFSILTLWAPAYGIEGIVKAVTAILSVATAVILWRLAPKLATLPSPAQLAGLNQTLLATMMQQEHTTALLRESEARGRADNAELERRIAEQTAELKAANADLTRALAERGVALQSVARTEEQFRASFEAAAVGKAQMQPETTRIIRANAAFAHMLGYEPEEMAGRTMWDLTWPEDLESCQADYARLLAGEIPTYVGEKRCLRRDGEPLWARVSGTIARSSETGEASLTVAVIEDIDQRHKAQLALVTAKADLEIVVQERTAALHQRDVLLREVYHRVKNNLQVIDGLLVMQASKLADPQAKTALRSLRSRIHALGLVHHQLMNSTNLKTFDIAPFLQELSANIIDGGGSGGIHLSVDAAPLEVGLDFAIPLGLLVTELVTNSIKHAFPGGKGNIAVSLQRRPDGEVALVVADDGRGWAADQTSPGRGATGLGTSIIQGLVAQLRGTLTMATDNGVRTEIRVPAPVLS